MDFVLVGSLVLVLFAAVVQVALAQHVRAVLVDSAAQGARYAALAGHTPADGEARTRRLVAESLSPAYTRDVSASRVIRDGLDLVEVRVRAPLPVAGLLGPDRRLDVTAHALAETP